MGGRKADELIDLYYSLRSPYRKTTSFLINDAMMKAIYKPKDNNGHYLWQLSITAGMPDTILQHPEPAISRSCRRNRRWPLDAIR
jgi:HK97 family phage major capsid protein